MEPLSRAQRTPRASEEDAPLAVPVGETVESDRLLQDWQLARERAEAYLAALELPAETRERWVVRAVERALTREAWPEGSGAVAETLRALRELLAEDYAEAEPEAARERDPFLARRLASWARAAPGEPAKTLPRRAGGRALASTPPLARGPMRPEGEGPPALLARLGRRLRGRAPSPRGDGTRGRRRPWARAARRRRALLVGCAAIPTVVASGFMLNVLPMQGATGLHLAIAVAFGLLFGWISIGFWTALMGFYVLVRGGDRFTVTRGLERAPEPLDPEARTAVVMPVMNEPVERVFAGLRATYRSLERSGRLSHFDLFVLSDSSEPAAQVEEERAWAAMARDFGAYGRVFYRRRGVHIGGKAGNIADFCRRFGRRYRYMAVLDADSLMSGETLVRMTATMERRPDVGILQSAPRAIRGRSLFARLQQFASGAYGPMFTAGLHFWQLGDSQYWGHNAILRVEPFMRHCALERLSGSPPLGGKILSHDFVESALMGRAGYGVWLAYDLPGSYEESPSTLLEELRRDRRWCQGNLQHLRLLFKKGLFPAHRAVFLTGIMSYVSALLWLVFLGLSTAEAIRRAVVPPDYFPSGRSLFPEWPIWRPEWAIALVAVTGVVLFLPKILALVRIGLARRAREFGGGPRLLASALVETLFSSLFAPIRMVFHSKFVLLTLVGRTVRWGSPGREGEETSWGEALRRHGVGTLVASAWAGTVYTLNPDWFWWLTPIVGALVLSIPLSVWASRIRSGERARAAGLLRIPEESAPPAELRALEGELRAAAGADAPLGRPGLGRAVVDPAVNALHRGLVGEPRSLAPHLRAELDALAERALEEGPDALEPAESRRLLRDPDALDRLHEAVWRLEPERARAWALPAA